MERILLLMDSCNINIPAIDFACYLSKLTGSRLTGVFLEDVLSCESRAFAAMETAAPMHAAGEGSSNLTERQVQTAITEDNISLFKRTCESQGMHASVRRDRGIPLKEVVAESRFADLLVVDPETSFSQRKGSGPSGFVRDILQDAECPVMIAPYSFHPIDEMFFAYNGSASSIFAIKQFTYLFPGLKDKKVSIVNVRDKSDGAIDDQYKMKEWLGQHYSNVALKLLEGDPSDELFGFLLDKKNAVVVMGAYGRGLLSRFLKPSHAHLIVKTVNMPIFITHH